MCEKDAIEEYNNPLPEKHLDDRTIYLSRNNYGPLTRPTGIIQLVDFDLAVHSRPGELHTGAIQAEIYRAPKVILNAGYTYSADIWSLGVMAKTSNARPSTPPPTDAPKPTLTEKDLEFDFDHSQIRDPRATPSRVRRPRYRGSDVSEEFLSKFHIPEHRQKHTDLLDTFYHLYRCHHKGPDGSPTYDSAGFQLDYKKVAKWMKPAAYNKKSMVNGMARHVKRVEEETKKIYDIFFIDGKGPEGEKGSTQVMDQIKDQVSKDLGVPWHQIDSKRLKEWEDKGFEKVNADQWWYRPNQVERDRFLKMLGGASLRKDL
ncbi:hypothetical protein IL306_007421 [Fusarium sp. DS 682]|nr:hypothetical protein IL306_007421 [Fusarium sp. DS 682]